VQAWLQRPCTSASFWQNSHGYRESGTGRIGVELEACKIVNSKRNSGFGKEKLLVFEIKLYNGAP